MDFSMVLAGRDVVRVLRSDARAGLDLEAVVLLVAPVVLAEPARFVLAVLAFVVLLVLVLRSVCLRFLALDRVLDVFPGGIPRTSLVPASSGA
jgi:hypothetical protein